MYRKKIVFLGVLVLLIVLACFFHMRFVQDVLIGIGEIIKGRPLNNSHWYFVIGNVANTALFILFFALVTTIIFFFDFSFIESNEKIKKSRYLIVVIGIVLLEFFFFRNVIGNDRLLGDAGDGRLTNFLAEHWFRFFSGKESFSDTLMFYPAKGTLGYSDLFLVFGVIHSIFRFVGLNMYDSYKLTLILVHAFGSFTFFYLLNKKFHINILWSLCGVIVFSYSTPFANAGFGHSQLSVINFLPLLTVFAVDFVNQFGNRKLRYKNGILFIVLYASILYTGWYVAFFVALFCFVFLVTYLYSLCRSQAITLGRCRQVLLSYVFDFFVLLVFFMILLVPFVIVYLPVLKSSGGYDYVPECIPDIIDIINVSSANFAFGKVVKLLHLHGGEVDMGFSLVVILLFVFCSCYLKKKNADSMKLYDLFLKNFMVAILVCVLLSLRISHDGHSLWWFVWKIIPGAKSIRAVGRIMFFLSYPVAVFLALSGEKFFSHFSVNRKMCILVFLIVFQIRVGGVTCDATWQVNICKEFIASVPAPPKDCEAFYVVDSSEQKKVEYLYQLDAYQIANFYDVPTINGYSGCFPNGWQNIWSVGKDEYEASVHEWIRVNRLKQVYSYDLTKREWKAIDGE